MKKKKSNLKFKNFLYFLSLFYYILKLINYIIIIVTLNNRILKISKLNAITI